MRGIKSMKKRIENYEEEKELYNQIRAMNDIEGTFDFDGKIITWHRNCNCNVFLQIQAGYILANRIDKHSEITHWHPDDVEEIIEDIRLAGQKGNMMVLFSSYLGTDGILYSGPADAYKDKFVLGKKYFFR